MSDPDRVPSTELVRPRQVTMAGWIIIAGSVAVVLSVFEQLTRLHSLETTQAIEKALSTPPWTDLDLGVEQTRTGIKVLAMMAGASATAAGILGWQALQRSRSARVGLAVLALPLFVGGVTTAWLSSVVVAAALVLWLQPARDWFAGRAPAAPTRPPGPVAANPPPEPAPPSYGAPMSDVQPPPTYQPSTQPSAQAPSQPSPYGPGYGLPGVYAKGSPVSGSSGSVSDKRPGTVTAAAWISIVFSVLTLLGCGLGIVGVLVARDSVVDELQADSRYDAFEPDQLITVLAVIFAVLIVWCLVAIVLSVLALRRSSVGRILLVVSAALAALVSLLGILSVVSALNLIAAIVVIVLLFTGGANDWYARSTRTPQGPPPLA